MVCWMLPLLMVAGCGKKNESEPILIGHLAPAGLDPVASDQAWRGIQLAVEQANQEENQVAGRRVQVLHPDCNQETLRATAVRLITINKVAALLGGTDASQVQVLGLVAKSAKVPLVAPGGMPNDAGGGFIFHTSVSPAHQGKVLARFAGTQWPGKAMTVLIHQQESLSSAASNLAAAFAQEYRTGGKIVGEWRYKNQAELKDLVRSIDADKPDAVVIAGASDDLMELHKAGLAETVPVLLGTSEGALAPLQARPLGNPVYLATAFVIAGGPVPAQEFARKYQDRFHEAADVHAALAYDSARLLFDGFRWANTVEGDRVRQALAELKTFESVTGPMTFLDQWACRPLFIVRVSNGQAKTVHTDEPEK
jgi:branched-chain amino acid transport system substrate-binding protein